MNSTPSARLNSYLLSSLIGIRSRALGRAVGETFRAGVLRTMGAAINDTVRLDAVSNDMTLAVRASRCERVDRAFETIECHRFARLSNFKRLVVVVTTDIANCHFWSSLFRSELDRHDTHSVENSGRWRLVPPDNCGVRADVAKTRATAAFAYAQCLRAIALRADRDDPLKHREPLSWAEGLVGAVSLVPMFIHRRLM